MKTADFDYFLPPECIAQVPLEPRHASRLLILHRSDGTLEHDTFWNIDRYLNRGDLLVINQTRVIPARLFARKPTGGKIEILLLKQIDPQTWEALVGGKRLLAGSHFQVENGPSGEVAAVLEGSRRLVRFREPLEAVLERAGHIPLPPYIHTPLADSNRYQTVYASRPGSAAAPTAGLHFTPELMLRLEEKGLRFARLTLHVGLDTFAPVTEEAPQDHKIHSEWCEVTPDAALLVNETRRTGGRIIAVGTTTVRTLETAAHCARPGEVIGAFAGPTELFILPGYKFQVTDALVTNFHLPCSTLLMLVSAYAGRERILAVYQEAVRQGYRFYSFGDAMLIL